MATKFAKGDVVRIKAVIPEGPVSKFRMDEETGVVSYLIEWTDAEGQVAQRWFNEDDLIGV